MKMKQEENAVLLGQFLNKLRAEGLSQLRVKKYDYTLRKLSKMLAKPFREAERADIEALLVKLDQSGYAEWSKHDFKVVIKRFWKWLKASEEGYPREVSWIKTTMKRNHEKLPEDLLTEDEVARLIQAADNIRDKALISTLYESGCRIGELQSMRLKSVAFNDYGVTIQIRGKTGSRKLLLISSTPYLANWLGHHPSKDPESPVWTVFRSKGTFRPLTYNTIRDLIMNLGQKAGLNKRLNPHNFRHSRATHLAKKLTEQQLNAYMGWVQGSGMTRVYVHLSGRDMDDAILEMHGIKKAEGQEQAGRLEPKKCPRCEKLNDFEARMCNRCGLPLDPETAIKLEQKMDDLAKLIDTPGILEKLIERKIEERMKTKNL
jgi:site-specific recombinase XerD